MNLAFIFNDSHNPDWTTPGGLSKALNRLGHSVDHYDLKNVKEIIELSKIHSTYDAVCLWEAGTISDHIVAVWHKDNFKNTLMIAESGDDPQIFRYNLRHTLPSDVILTPDADACNEYRRMGKNAYWMTHWGDESVWTLCTPKDTGIISTSAGPRPGMWKSLMDVLRDNFLEKFMNPRMLGGQYMSVEDNVKLYDNSDVIVQVSSNKEITRRLFEASVCGRVVLADKLSYTKKLNECLVEDLHIALYETPDECVAKAHELLQDSDKRNKMAKAAYEHVLKNHSAAARANQLIQIIKNNK
jgi:hypothetical protein